MKEAIIEKLSELTQLAIADNNKELQGIVYIVRGALYANQEAVLFKGMVPLAKELLGKINDAQAQQN